MLRHYIKIAVRNLIKHSGYTWINVMGLAIGMACCLLILLFVQDEMSYDRFHEKGDRIYRLAIEWRNPQTGARTPIALGPYRLAEALRVDFPDIPHIVRLYPQGNTTISRDTQAFNEQRFFFVDPDFFDVFSFSLIKGDPSTALRDPYTMVVTEAIAKKYFGDEDPVGQTLRWQDDEMRITGIVEEAPDNAHFHFDFLASMTLAKQEFSRIVLENWGEGTSYTYLLLPETMAPADLAARLPAFIEKNVEEGASEYFHLSLQPLTDIHLHSHTIREIEPNGDITYVYAFSAIAFFVLLIACINFMNLTTARSANRAREVGLRKVVGAYRRQLVQQFLGEVVILSLVGMALAVGLAVAVLPAFNGFIEKELTLDPRENAGMLVILTAIVLFVGFIAGSYPALFLSRFRPVEVLKGALAAGSGGSALRKILVTFQFAVSIFLLIVTAIVYNQLEYARTIDLGFEKEHIVVIPGVPTTIRQNYDQFRQELTAHPNVLLGAFSSRVPPGQLGSNIGTRPEGVPEDQRQSMQTIWTDYDIIELLGIDLAAGRSFSRDFPTDATAAFVINESAAAAIGWTPEEAVGKRFGSSEIRDWNRGQWEQRDGQVIGVIKDFHFESLHDAIGPTVYFIAPYMASNYLIRIGPNNIPETLQFIEGKFREYSPNTPFQYRFVDEAFDALYRTEERQMTVFGIFAGLAIAVGCLGLIGLASFTAEQRTKEIGVRKVLGASVSSVVVLLSKEFSKLVLLANLFAWPLAYYVMSLWLQDFVYRVDISLLTFLFSALVALLISWVTVGAQAMKAAMTNPVDALRYE